ncbi:MAG: hypothetical protein AAFQ47_06020 [Pseudomonadota bacterium]
MSQFNAPVMIWFHKGIVFHQKQGSVVTIVLIEKDPFVRIDMSEALAVAFPNVRVVTLEQLDQTVSDVAVPHVVILDTPLGELTDSAMVKAWTDAGAQIILTGSRDQAGDLKHQTWQNVERPFTDQMLLDVIQKPE